MNLIQIQTKYGDKKIKDYPSIHFEIEEGNEYDENAIRALDNDGEFLGYVAKNPHIPRATPLDGVWNNKILKQIINNKKKICGELVEQREDNAIVKVREFNCILCDKCKFHMNGLSKKECFTFAFWYEDVYLRKNMHFMTEDGSVFAFVKGKGGFGNTRYDITFEDGDVLEDYGLWHRGTAPASIQYLFKKHNRVAKREIHKR